MASAISSQLSENKEQRYDLLFEEGLALIQKYSGKIWTDYNYHDPGVTFLEYLCYALTDLGYRTDFPVQDLFLIGHENKDPVRENLFFGPEKVFSSSPFTVNDYRKLIIDRVKQVANAWVVPVFDNKLGIKGLFDIFIECGEDLSTIEIEFLRNEICSVFFANRLLGHDLNEIHILKKVNLSVHGDVYIESDEMAEMVISKIYARLDNYINPFVELYDPVKLWKEKGIAPEMVFTGPLPKFGYILENDLTPKVEAIYLSRIKELILDVQGVKEVRNIRLYKNGIPVFDNFVHFKPDEFPKIQFLDELTETFDNHIKIHKNGVAHDVDPVISKQLISSELLARSKFYHHEVVYDRKIPQGRFSKDDIQQHFPIHHELPEFFGVGKNGISKNSSKEEQASAMQLTAYLYFFEQFMASYLAQLANTRHLFSIQELKSTYFNQIPEKIEGLQDLLKDYPSFLQFLDGAVQSKDQFYDRRNRVLDQLLARFGEKFDVASLKKLSSGNALQSSEELSLAVIDCKRKFLESIVELGQSKVRAFDLLGEAVWDEDNLSGLEKRIALSLNIKNFNRRYIAPPILEALGVGKSQEKKKYWALETLILENRTVQVFKLPSEDYGEEQTHFMGKGMGFIQELFQVLYNEKSISCVGDADNKRYYLLMKQKSQDFSFVVFESESREKCLLAKSKVLEKLHALDIQSEGFHMIEHILLRPTEPVSYLFSFLNPKGEVFLEGMLPGGIDEQKSLGEELAVYATDIQNYSILEEQESKKLTVVVYNTNHEAIGKLTKQFNSRPGTKKAIEETISFFQKVENKELGFDAIFEVNHVGGAGHGFPSEFEFSHTMSFIFPDWPSRFSKADFLGFVKKLIADNILAHQDVNLYFLNPIEMARFEGLYHEWLLLKNTNKPDQRKIDLLSLQIIQMLSARMPVD